VATLTPALPARRIEVPRLLRLWHLTSLDAVTVAVIWTVAFAWAAHLSLPWWPPVVVGLSAWSFYIADRLLDARRACTPLRTRHYFHWQHRNVFLPLAAGCGISALVLVLWKMPFRFEMRDSVIAVAAVAYFARVHTSGESNPFVPRRKSRRWVRKELLVALVFTAACAAPALARSMTRWSLVPVLMVFAALAWLNCHAIESWESGDASSVRPAMQWLIAATFTGAVCMAFLHEPRMCLLLLSAGASACLLGLLDHHQQRLSGMALRTLADLVLLTPLVVVALA
jgi:hypothetical protein